ncbi:MAG TPA: hypothetical protein PKM63_06630 [Panacibacter sp.]|nr:hypothetical protein [Panacibacter sp.]HNP43943.1 hypothetical protein [Panacibacter sp.]
MKKTAYFLSVLFAFSGTACNKQSTTISAIPASAEINASAVCTATKADAENIQIFPANNAWNTDISTKAPDPHSSQVIAQFAAAGIHCDFGSGLWAGAPIGIPYVVVCSTQQKYTVKFRANGYDGNYGSESDKGPYAIPLDAAIEGNGNGDSHVIAVDKDSGILYELYNADTANGTWQASSGAIFHFNTNALRPKGWTSADAAGLPIFAGLVRYDEIQKGVIDHVIRFTLSNSHVYPAYVSPARHKVNSSGVLYYSLPFGARIRLKADFDISSFSATNKIILTAMKKYGLMLADIGSDMYISGAPDARWNNDDLHDLGRVHASDFEVVKVK